MPVVAGRLFIFQPRHFAIFITFSIENLVDQSSEVFRSWSFETRKTDKHSNK